MRVLVVRPGPQFSVSDVARGWTKGLVAAGCQIADFDFDQRLTFYGGAHLKDHDGNWIKAFSDEGAVHLAAKGIEVAALEYWPDLVLVISGFFVPAPLYELLRARGIRTVLIHTESPYEDIRQMARAACADINIINDPTNLESFRVVNPNTWFLPAAYDPDLHRPGRSRDECRSDFCFVGTGYQSRIDFFEAVNWSGIDVAFAGNWGSTDPDSPLRKFLAHDVDACCPNDQAVDMYRATKVSANLYRREAEAAGLEDGWAMGPREVELAATGCFYLRDHRGEGDEVLPMLPMFDGPADFEDKLRWWLAHPDERNAVVVKARAAIADRTFTHHAQQLLRLLDQ